MQTGKVSEQGFVVPHLAAERRLIAYLARNVYAVQELSEAAFWRSVLDVLVDGDVVAYEAVRDEYQRLEALRLMQQLDVTGR